MKTIHLYEASDIDFNDPVHAFVMAQILITLVSFRRGADTADAEAHLKEMVAALLNAATKAGISITKAEVPDVFGG